MKLLNLGCGNVFHPDWANVDMHPCDNTILRHNLLEPLPFKAGSFDVVYHSHVLEHFKPEEGQRFIKEGERVLRSGGIMRLVVPDMERIVRDYLESLNAGAKGWHEWTILEIMDQSVREKTEGRFPEFIRNADSETRQYIQRYHQDFKKYEKTTPTSAKQNPSFPKSFFPFPIFRNRLREWLLSRLLGKEYEMLCIGRFRRSGEIHHWMYDELTLSQLLAESGFIRIEKKPFDKSNVSDWTGYHLDQTSTGAIRKGDSLFMEAIKP